MRRPSSLLVRVVEVSLGDGALAPPQVGAVTDFPLTFVESEMLLFSSDGHTAEELMTVRGVLDLDDIGPHEHQDADSRASWWMWRGLLRGDGWTATWYGRRPRIGPVELTGYFATSLDCDPGRVRGRITRVRIISQLCQKVDDGSWESIADEPNRYRDVDRASQVHSDAPTLRGDGSYYRDFAALIDLDIDDVPPLMLRPRVVPAIISAVDDHALWVADTELPLVTRLDTNTDEAVEYVLAACADKRRRVAATPTGCWVYGDGLYRITTGEPAYRAGNSRIFNASVSGETLLVYDAESTWTLHSPSSDPIRVALSEGRPAAIGIDSGSGDFVAVLNNGGSSDRRLQVLRVATTGQVAVGPRLQPPSSWAQRPFLAGTPLRLFYGGVVSTINDDLTFGPPVRLPTNHVDGGALGEGAWILTYRSSADPLTPWWPLPDPDVPTTPLPRVPILTVLDSSTLTPQVSWRVEKLRAVTSQSSMVWVTDRDHLYRLDAASSPNRPEPVDIAALITESIAPTIERDRDS